MSSKAYCGIVGRDNELASLVPVVGDVVDGLEYNVSSKEKIFEDNCAYGVSLFS